MLKNKIKYKIKRYRDVVRKAYWSVDSLRFRGARFYCGFCGGKFDRMRDVNTHYSIRGEMIDHYTPNEICPKCRSNTRARFILAFLEDRGDIIGSEKHILHFAPEPGIEQVLSVNPNYITADIEPHKYKNAVFADITDIGFDDNRFDLVICIHVLEHIEADRQALAEIYRVLKPGGLAVIALPTYGEETYEEPGLDGAGRERVYGIDEHVRLNGLDVTEKMAAAGFDVKVITKSDVPGNYWDSTIRTPHTESDKYLFICRKPSG